MRNRVCERMCTCVPMCRCTRSFFFFPDEKLCLFYMGYIKETADFLSSVSHQNGNTPQDSRIKHGFNLGLAEK